MKVLGLTGGVGMGKSTAADFLRSLGVPVVDTDDIARQLVEPGRPALEEIKKQFGDGIVSPGGGLNRAGLAQIVFTDTAARKKLEAILHPRIRESWLAQIEKWRSEDFTLAAVVIPLLYETQAESRFDRIVCVACSAAEQRKRLSERGWSPDQIRRRIAAQLPAEQKIARADFVVWTDGALETHRRQIEDIIGRTA